MTTVEHERGTIGRITGALLLALAIVATSLLGFADVASAANPTYQTTDAVSARSAPTSAPTGVYGLPNGASFRVDCQVEGQPVGPRGNKLYFRTVYSGRTMYVPDYYTNSPHLAAQPPIAGIPMCGAATPPPPPPPPAVPGPNASFPSTIGGAAAVRGCTNMAVAGCSPFATLGAGTGVRMTCWIDDSTVTVNYSSARWFWVTSTTGVDGFVHSSNVASQTQKSVGACSANRGVSAARWAATKLGSTKPSPAETNRNAGMDRWSGWCYVFAFDAHALSHGTRPLSDYGTAKNTFARYQQLGRASGYSNPSAIPVGSIVFWSMAPSGHAAIYVGNGSVITTQGNGSSLPPIARLPLTSFGSPSGWVAPGNI